MTFTALKTNRVIFPEGHERLGIKLHQFAKSLNIEDFDLVTVKEKQYYIYNYLGKLKDVNDNITMNRKWKIKMYKNDH